MRPRRRIKWEARKPPGSGPAWGATAGAECAGAATPAPAAPATHWRRHTLTIAALWGCALIAYSSSFRTGFPFDNTQAILLDSRVHAVTPENLHLIWTQDYWYNSSTTGLYRPLTTLSYLFNYAVLG